jgi:hypothetical protein
MKSMANHSFWSRLILRSLVAFPAILLAQAPGGGAAGGPNRGKPEDAFISSDKDTRPYNKHDFNGLWSRNPQTYGLPACSECRDPDRGGREAADGEQAGPRT